MKTKVSGIDRLRRKLKRKQRDLRSSAPKENVEVGYTQSYALAVHEVPANHDPGKRDKYLTGPLRDEEQNIRRVIAEETRQNDLATGLLMGALYLQRKSQEVVPIDTGALKASSYTAVHDEAAEVAQKAFERSEAIRQAAR